MNEPTYDGLDADLYRAGLEINRLESALAASSTIFLGVDLMDARNKRLLEIGGGLYAACRQLLRYDGIEKDRVRQSVDIMDRLTQEWQRVHDTPDPSIVYQFSHNQPDDRILALVGKAANKAASAGTLTNTVGERGILLLKELEKEGLGISIVSR